MLCKADWFVTAVVVVVVVRYANLPDSAKEKTVHAESMYSFGWSHGKEMMKAGVPDYSKGSYYANPQYDDPFNSDPELLKRYPSFCHPNIWPSDDLPQLEHAFKAMGQLVVKVGLLVAKQCDTYVKSRQPSYSPDNRLFDIINTAKTCKARLLHYFPAPDSAAATNATVDEDSISSWCGWHNDHGSLTGLVPAMYMNSAGEEVPNPDPASGLYIRSRTGNLVQVKVPADHLAFQIGETAQIHSGGVLQATPHCVRAAQGEKASGISRETFAVFMEPMWNERMNAPAALTDLSSVSSSKFLPAGQCCYALHAPSFVSAIPDTDTDTHVHIYTPTVTDILTLMAFFT